MLQSCNVSTRNVLRTMLKSCGMIGLQMCPQTAVRVRATLAATSILCYPEDRRCSSCPYEATHSAGQPERRSGRVQGPDPYQLCNACELPVCRGCWCRMRQKLLTGVSQALTNDNWCGYPVDLPLHLQSPMGGSGRSVSRLDFHDQFLPWKPIAAM